MRHKAGLCVACHGWPPMPRDDVGDLGISCAHPERLLVDWFVHQVELPEMPRAISRGGWATARHALTAGLGNGEVHASTRLGHGATQHGLGWATAGRTVVARGAPMAERLPGSGAGAGATSGQEEVATRNRGRERERKNRWNQYFCVTIDSDRYFHQLYEISVF